MEEDEHVRDAGAKADEPGDLADEPAAALQVALAMGGAERARGRGELRPREEVPGEAPPGQAQEQEPIAFRERRQAHALRQFTLGRSLPSERDQELGQAGWS